MNYKATLPEQNHNVSHNHPLREFVILLAGVAGIVLVVFWALGGAVDVAVDYLPPAKEKLLFAKLSKQFPAATNVSDDKVAVLQQLTDSLGSCVDVGYPVEVRVVDSEMVNAFAFPGGAIVIFTGLLDKVQSENGLAFILAHELGHYKNRDHLRGMGRGIVLATISTILTGANSGISQMLAPTNEFGMAQYSQDREGAADSTALAALNCYYGHVGGAAEFFETMQGEINKDDAGLMQYFASHPQMKKRIDALVDLAARQGYVAGPTREMHF